MPKRNARYYRRHPEGMLRQVASFDGPRLREYTHALLHDKEALGDLMTTPEELAEEERLRAAEAERRRLEYEQLAREGYDIDKNEEP